MSIVSEIESLYASFRFKVGTVSAELESHFSNFLASAKSEEAAAEAKVQAEIAHLESLGYAVTKAVEGVVGVADAAAAPLVDPSTEPAAAA